MAASVNCSQPRFWWEAGFWASTERIELSKKTPCLAQRVRSPLADGERLKSAATSLKMFWSDGGRRTPSRTEKAKP